MTSTPAVTLNQALQSTQFNLPGFLIFGLMSGERILAPRPIDRNPTGAYDYACALFRQAKGLRPDGETLTVFKKDRGDEAEDEYDEEDDRQAWIFQEVRADQSSPHAQKLRIERSHSKWRRNNEHSQHWLSLSQSRLLNAGRSYDHGSTLSLYHHVQTGGFPELNITLSREGIGSSAWQSDKISPDWKRPRSSIVHFTLRSREEFLRLLKGEQTTPDAPVAAPDAQCFSPQDLPVMLELSARLFMADPKALRDGFRLFARAHVSAAEIVAGRCGFSYSKKYRVTFDDNGEPSIRAAGSRPCTVEEAIEGITMEYGHCHLQTQRPTSLSSPLRRPGLSIDWAGHRVEVWQLRNMRQQTKVNPELARMFQAVLQNIDEEIREFDRLPPEEQRARLEEHPEHY